MSDDLHQTSSGKRLDVISWDEFFMSVAIAAQRRSKDPNTQVGACIASTNTASFRWATTVRPRRSTTTFSRGVRATTRYRTSTITCACRGQCRAQLPWLAQGPRGSTVYVTLFPCHDCAKILAQVGVGEVVYLDNKYADTDDGRISRRILDSCGISYRQVIVDVHIGTGEQAQQ